MVVLQAQEIPRHERPGFIVSWVRADPIRAVATVLILLQLLWRADIAVRGYFSQDEWFIASRSAESPLTADFLLQLFNNHLMPGGWAIAWGITHATGHEIWPHVLVMLTFQALFSIAFYRLLRLMFEPSWVLLLPLSVVLFSPLMLETTSLWVVGLLILPVLLSLTLAIGAQIKYLQTGRLSHLAWLALSMVLGLLFSEKALFAIPAVFLVTACLYERGGLWRSTWRTLTRHWRSWLVMLAVAGFYFYIYQYQSVSSAVREPASTGEVTGFLGDLAGVTMIPGMFGGPWRWVQAGDGPPLMDPPNVLMWMSWLALAGLIALTVWRRPIAARAWVMPFAYFGLIAAMLAATRMGAPLSPLAGLVARYVADVVILVALALAAALLPVRNTPTAPEPRPMPTAALIAGGVVIAVFATGTIWSTALFRDNWDTKNGMAFLEASQAELAKAPPGTLIFDSMVPNNVIEGYWYPYNQQSKFFLPARYRPTFVTEAENPYVIDASGHIRKAVVGGVNIKLPGPVPDCHWIIEKGVPTTIPLDVSVYHWPWAVRFGYLSSGESTATFRLGNTTRQLNLKSGLNEVTFLLEGSGDSVEITVHNPAVAVCTGLITVGTVHPVS